MNFDNIGKLKNRENAILISMHGEKGETLPQLQYIFSTLFGSNVKNNTILTFDIGAKKPLMAQLAANSSFVKTINDLAQTDSTINYATMCIDDLQKEFSLRPAENSEQEDALVYEKGTPQNAFAAIIETVNPT